MSYETDMRYLLSELDSLKRRLQFQERLESGGRWIYLTTPLTSTSWDGDARSTTAKTKIDLSAVFGVPADVIAVVVRVAARDSGSRANTGVFFGVSGNNITGDARDLALVARPGGKENDSYDEAYGPVPCDENGDIYYLCTASGSGTMDVYLQVYGYWI